ncbi:uncharacterized protein LOC141627915 [Silene latifolia]|uniref:uncharacterized protein LOC141627915 n=1 Tax=Silene latifolia TaxID=37657 RepID=UPI003D782121
MTLGLNLIMIGSCKAGPYSRYLEPHETKQVLQEIHDGYYGNHKGGRNMASKILRTGYYWPTLRADCLDHCAKREACQIHALIIHQPSELLHSISAPRPFMNWGHGHSRKTPNSSRPESIHNINLVTSTSGYPKANGQAESSNKVVIRYLKKKLKSRRGTWAEELLLVVWADRTTPKT